MGLYSLVLLWFCGDLTKKISLSVLISKKDCENDIQKCSVSKMKSMMEIVEQQGREQGLGKVTHFIWRVVQGVKSSLKMWS